MQFWAIKWMQKLTIYDVQFPQAMTDLIDINLNGTLYFTRIGLAYLNADAQGTVTSATNGSLTFSKSLTLVSSAAGFKESPGLCAYSASKHGIIGVVRALRGLTPQLYNVRVNAICPWATDTAMIAQVVDLWKRSGMPLNTADDIALFNIQCAADPRLNGRSVFVGGGKGFDIEEGIDRLEPEWLGKKQSDDFLRQAEVFGSVSDEARPIPALICLTCHREIGRNENPLVRNYTRGEQS